MSETIRRQALVPALRCARASAERGDFCRQNEVHFNADYCFVEPRDQGKPGSPLVEKWACRICWKPEENPGAITT